MGAPWELCYIEEPKKMVSDSKMKAGNTKIITQLSNGMLSIKHGVKVIHKISHLFRAYQCMNKQFINCAKKLEPRIVFKNDLGLAIV